MREEFLNLEVLESVEAPADWEAYAGVAIGTIIGGGLGYGAAIVVLT